jgi:hypothetical protein
MGMTHGFQEPEGHSTPRRNSMNDVTHYSCLDGQAREAKAKIEHHHPLTKIKHLREYYGAHFANGWDGESTLGELLAETEFPSLAQYVKYYRHYPRKRS